MAYRDWYRCSSCNHEWQTRKERGEPPSCPRCGNKDITNESKEKRDMQKEWSKVEGVTVVDGEGEIQEIEANCPLCQHLIVAEIEDKDSTLNVECPECNEKWQIRIDDIQGKLSSGDRLAFQTPDHIFSEQIEQYDLDVTTLEYIEMLKEYRDKSRVFNILGYLSMSSGFIISFLGGKNTFSSLLGLILVFLPIVSYVSGHYVLKKYLPGPINRLPRDLRLEWKSRDVLDKY